MVRTGRLSLVRSWRAPDADGLVRRANDIDVIADVVSACVHGGVSERWKGVPA